MKIRLVTYSTKPRGGVVHALCLAEALTDRGHDVELWALSADGAAFFREPRAQVRLVPVDKRPAEDVEPRILRYAATLAEGMRAAGRADIHHSEDCLSARSLLALRAEGLVPAIVRTIHHIDDFASPVLADCQRASIEDVDHRICVSAHWAEIVARDHGVGAEVIANGVDADRYARCPLDRPAAGAYLGWGARPTVLAVGGLVERAIQGRPLRLAIATRLLVFGAVGLGLWAASRGFDLGQYRMIVYALALVLIMIFRPEGLLGLHEIWDRAAWEWLLGRRKPRGGSM